MMGLILALDLYLLIVCLQVGEINVIVEQVSKQNSVLLEENEALKVS